MHIRLFDLVEGDLVTEAMLLALAIYLVLTLDARRANSPAAGDQQIGLKTIAASLTLVGASVLSRGLRALLYLGLTMHDFGPRFRGAMPDVLVGAAAVGVFAGLVLPRTNLVRYPKTRRLIAGALALFGGISAIVALSSTLTEVFAWTTWDAVSKGLASFLTASGSFAVGLYLLAKQSGVEVPEIPSPRPMGPPQKGPLASSYPPGR